MNRSCGLQPVALDADPGFGETPGREAVLESVRNHGFASGWLAGDYLRPDGSVGIDDVVPVGIGTPMV